MLVKWHFTLSVSLPKGSSECPPSNFVSNKSSSRPPCWRFSLSQVTYQCRHRLSPQLMLQVWRNFLLKRLISWSQATLPQKQGSQGQLMKGVWLDREARWPVPCGCRVSQTGTQKHGSERLGVIEGCAGVPAQSFCVRSMPPDWDTVMENSHPLEAVQAEENVVCNLELARCHFLSSGDKVDQVHPEKRIAQQEECQNHQDRWSLLCLPGWALPLLWASSKSIATRSPSRQPDLVGAPLRWSACSSVSMAWWLFTIQFVSSMSVKGPRATHSAPHRRCALQRQPWVGSS